MTNKIWNSIHGMAYGDAWGRITEFEKFVDIKEIQPEFPKQIAYITDDTQMSLYAMKAILDNLDSILEFENDLNNVAKQNNVRMLFGAQFLEWQTDPRNNRAPGYTCLNSLTNLRNSEMRTGLEGTDSGSKGCGANMRNPWFGLLPFSEELIEELSLQQSEVTHSHPLALSSAVLTALCLRETYLNPNALTTLNLNDFLLSKTTELIVKHSNNSKVRPAYLSGLHELKSFLELKQGKVKAFTKADPATDICEILNAEGWVAEEALLLAVTIYDNYKNSPIEGLRRAVYTNGDSDSIAAIAGAYMGSTHNTQIFPEQWHSKLEPNYIEELQTTVEGLQEISAKN